ncbi:MAG: hypothetical protein RL660_2566 [Bacteroidota bacterium]|jgi:hypothetical protein
MKKIIVLGILGLSMLSSTDTFAQEKKPQVKKKRANSTYAALDLQLGSMIAPSLSYSKDWYFLKNQKLIVGTGARLTSVFGSNALFITAPAKLTSGKTGPGVFFADQIPANIDSFTFSGVQANAINIPIHIGYRISKKLSAGFNIDAIGISLGGKKQAVQADIINNIDPIYNAKPTFFNALLISDNDLGTLNSQLYARYQVNKTWGARLGAGFLFTEYTTTTVAQVAPGGISNSRFRNKALGLSLGVTRSF